MYNEFLWKTIKKMSIQAIYRNTKQYATGSTV